MPKDLLLYGYIHSDSAMEFFKTVNDLEEDSDVTLRINTGGGEPHYMMGVLNKIKELGIDAGTVDGMAFSAGAYACCLLANVKGVQGSQYLIHRAAMWYESYPELFTDADKKRLEDCNKFLKKILTAKVDVKAFEKIAKHTIEEIFSTDARIDVVLTDSEAKRVGLIDEIIKLTPNKKRQIETRVEAQHDEKFKIAAKKILNAEADEDDDDDDEPASTKTKPNTHIMTTLDELKAKYPALYAQAVAEGEKSGTKKEQDRVAGWMAWVKVDPTKVVEAIKKGDELNIAALSELQAAAVSPEYLDKLRKDSAKPLATTGDPDPAKDAKQKEIEAFEKGINATLGIKEKPTA